MELVTIKTSRYATELAVLQTRLENEGIHCYLKDELSSQVLGHISAVEAELQVSDEDLPRVHEILEELGEA